MTPLEFRTLLFKLNLQQTEFSRLVSVTPRAVNLWALGHRPVPGPVQAYINLLYSLPQRLKDAELAKLRYMPKKENPEWLVPEADNDPD